MKKEVTQNTPEWLEMRKSHIGASDAPVIMGVSPFERSDGFKKTPYTLWKEKLDILPEDKGNWATKFGSKMEDPARKVYEEMKGEEFSPKVIFHDTIDYMMASLDGISKDGKRSVEIKNANAEDHDLAKKGEIPTKYFPQLQHQLICSKHDEMDYFSFHKGEGVIVRVFLDAEYKEELLKKEAEFWSCISNFVAPKMVARDHRKRDGQWRDHAVDLINIKEEIKKVSKSSGLDDLKNRKEKAEKLLRDISAGESSYFEDIFYTNSPRKGTIDYRSIPELNGVDLKPYTKHSSVWTIAKK